MPAISILCNVAYLHPIPLNYEQQASAIFASTLSSSPPIQADQLRRVALAIQTPSSNTRWGNSPMLAELAGLDKVVQLLCRDEAFHKDKVQEELQKPVDQTSNVFLIRGRVVIFFFG